MLFVCECCKTSVMVFVCEMVYVMCRVRVECSGTLLGLSI